MTLDEAKQELLLNGWSLAIKDNYGNNDALLKIRDIYVYLDIKINRLVERQELMSNFSISTKEFSVICSYIRDDGLNKYSLKSHLGTWSVVDNLISSSHVQQLCQDVIDWVGTLDYHKCLCDCAQIPTDAFGVYPIRHLGALAILGDIDKLQFYQDSFQKGDRLGFVPYITIDYIERALLKAHEYKNAANKK